MMEAVAANSHGADHEDDGPRHGSPLPLSVIVPMHNASAHIGRCLDALLEQGIEAAEVIVVDDASTDGSAEAVSKVAERLPEGLTLVRLQINVGPGAARNIGLDIAKGEFVGFADADDLPCKGMYTAMLSRAVAQNADIVICGFRRIDEVTGRKDRTFLPGDWHQLAPSDAPGLFLDRRSGDVLHPCWNKLFRRKFLEINGLRFPETRFAEDFGLVFKAMACAPAIATIPAPLYDYTVRHGTASTALMRRCGSFRTLLDVKDWMRERKESGHGLGRAFRRQVWLHAVYFPACFILLDSMIGGAERLRTLRDIPVFLGRLLAFFLKLCMPQTLGQDAPCGQGAIVGHRP
jgi:glycosyltransferase involved in cell wall biosynthesis